MREVGAPSTHRELHISRTARERYGIADAPFALTGNVVLVDPAAVRALTTRINERGGRAVPLAPGALLAAGLIDEILHFVVAQFRDLRDPQALQGALEFLKQRLGREQLDATLLTFVEEFPNATVHRGGASPNDWLRGETAGVSNRAVALEELLLLWLSNANPAFEPMRELFDDSGLARYSAYSRIVAGLGEWFGKRPRFGPFEQSLVDMLRSPAIAAPDSLAGQLRYIREHWGYLLGDLLVRLLTGLDLLSEEERALLLRQRGPSDTKGDSSAEAVLRFTDGEAEPEGFSADRDWMPRVVLIAKSVHVWLHQLSVQYGRAIGRLDQIPDEELDRLARWGITGLWLIGLWERSRASERIKQLCGNPEAAASAYSLLDYRIAPDLGGEEACASLRDRAWARGIRLASDMVPNHMGIDSRWVIERPHYFLSVPYSPFPSYRFDGPDLSTDPRVAIHLEQHYFDRSDAAVVFQRVDRVSGETRFLYHGNDGTSFPWNDTAQLDFLKPEVREEVLRTILHVARLFPIIRFDAAMTLAKKHFQRLWYPEPGTGGAIPSRAEHGLSRAAFDAAMPQEFWREVVDRVAAEAPDTLLLAEAFWLMEGYFVRTLGMHRVYNSAFMNMLRDEQNANYRSVIKNTLEFDPEVLKRYVNFMNNPDERTAVEQFGKSDKYFGVATLMATLPGLPMFGHGQIEGYTEKYGMEYRRAYHDEAPDQGLVREHERVLFPLLHRRRLFAEVREFLLYDFFIGGGAVNEDVFAYSNRDGSDRALVVYNNRFAETAGWIRVSAAYAEKLGERRGLSRRTLGEGLALPSEPGALVRFRDAVTELEHLRRADQIHEQGLYFELPAYRRCVFLDWSEVARDGRPWAQLADELGGGGTVNLESALLDLELRPVHEAFRACANAGLAREMAAAGGGRDGTGNGAVDFEAEKDRERWMDEGGPVVEEGELETQAAPPLGAVEPNAVRLFDEVLALASGGGGRAAGLETRDRWLGNVGDAAEVMGARLDSGLRIPALEALFRQPWPAEAAQVLPTHGRATPAAAWGAVLAWTVVESLGRLSNPRAPLAAAARLLDALRLGPPIAAMLRDLGLEADEAWRSVARIRASFQHAGWGFAPAPAPASGTGVASAAAPAASPLPGEARTGGALRWLADPEPAWLIGANQHDGVRWFSREAFLRLIWWMALPPLLDLAAPGRLDAMRIAALEGALAELTRRAEVSGYRLEEFLAIRSDLSTRGNEPRA